VWIVCWFVVVWEPGRAEAKGAFVFELVEVFNFLLELVIESFLRRF